MKIKGTSFILLVNMILALASAPTVNRGRLGAPSVIIPPTPTPTSHQPLNEQIKRNSGYASGAPVRGTIGDNWADIIIGEPDFSQITPNEVVGNKLFNPGGVYVDRSVQPNRVYVYDAGNSRVLGMRYLGTAQGGPETGQPCTSDSDHPGSVCLIDQTRSADIVLGQSSFNSSTCNGDSGMLNYPTFPPPSNATLCGLNPEQVSIGEGGSEATMAADSQGNLYLPDVFNNRVLRYDSPFATDAIADYVWGQADFASATCNRGASYGSPTNRSLCLAPTLGNGNYLVGVAIDAQGNLWVTDTQNNRVLRFPYGAAAGVPAQTADLVLGQSNFTTATAGTGLEQMTSPASVRVDSNGNVFVVDGFAFFGAPSRILIFHPPLSNGMAASHVIQSGLSVPRGLELDATSGLWVSDPEQQKVLRYDANGNLQQTFGGIPKRISGGLGVDRDNNIMLTGWDPQQVLVYTPPSYDWNRTFLAADEYGSFNSEGARGLNGPMGMEVAGDQLVVGDGPRMLFWTAPWRLTNNYPPADGVIGQPDFTTRPRWAPIYTRMRADNQGRIWVIKGHWFDSGTAPEIQGFQLPLTMGALPVLRLTSPLPLKGGGTFTWSWSLVDGGIAQQPGCDCLWLSDRDYHRVFRIRNVSTNPVVDIVLGQTSLSGIHCNQGRDSDNGYVHPSFPAQDSLCFPGGLAFDRRGNLYVADHSLEVAGNWRLLEFDANAIPNAPASAVFGIHASRVFGRNGSFTEPDCTQGDPMCGPWEPGFNSRNEMVIGFNAYLGPNFPQVYHDPLTNSLPSTSLNDFYSQAYSVRFDQFDTLYVLDHTRNRVLIYLNQSMRSLYLPLVLRK